MSTFFYQVMATPIGPMLSVTSRAGVHVLSFMEPHEEAKSLLYWEKRLQHSFRHHLDEMQALLSQELKAYFQGTLQAFTIPLVPAGTFFQQQVWRTLGQVVPWGKTTSYLALAQQVGRPKAYRAVANANGANPVCILIPCHRVIHANGGLCGYGAGLDKKCWLLQHEGWL